MMQFLGQVCDVRREMESDQDWQQVEPPLNKQSLWAERGWGLRPLERPILRRPAPPPAFIRCTKTVRFKVELRMTGSSRVNNMT